MEIVYSIFIGMIVGKNVGMIDGIVLQCRRDIFNPTKPWTNKRKPGVAKLNRTQLKV